MKRRLAVLLTGLTCLLAASVASRAAVEVSFSAGIEINSANDFYEPLTPYGEWVSVGAAALRANFKIRASQRAVLVPSRAFFHQTIEYR